MQSYKETKAHENELLCSIVPREEGGLTSQAGFPQRLSFPLFHQCETMNLSSIYMIASRQGKG